MKLSWNIGSEDESFQLSSAVDEELRQLIKEMEIRTSIIGCGGGGSNAVGRLAQVGVGDAILVAANSDAKHLLGIRAPYRLLLGKETTRGLGAGSIPQVGKYAAEEARDEIRRYIDGCKVVFVTAGMGGGTGTGAAPYVAEMARRNGSLVIGVVTLPFKAEGKLRMNNALRGLEELRRHCDTTITILNDQLLKLVPKLPLEVAFKVADEVLMQSIKGINDVVAKPGLVNVDFNDVSSVMRNGGMATIGLGESDDPRDRVQIAVEDALASPLLGEIELSNARGALVRVQGGPDMTIGEAEKAAKMISDRISPRARIIWGCSVEPELEGMMKVMLVITGVTSPHLSEKAMKG
ncbi:MAG: cell division protein FtsZ [Euryarchaeota archaeon]|nr:cell division protein FtsZ [Euryarchaeota archaeon]